MITISPSRPRGIVEVPASKSQTIRALLIAAFARGVSVIRHPLISSDTLSAVRAVEAMGAAVTFSDDDSIATVDSSGMQPDATITIDAGNSGTTTYLLLPMAASLGVPVTITGDEQLRKRPVGPLKEALKELGAEISDSNGYPPITVKGPLKGGNTSSDIIKYCFHADMALIAGQIERGVPLWVLPDNTSIAIFPGNVGSKDSLLKAYRRLSEKHESDATISRNGAIAGKK